MFTPHPIVRGGVVRTKHWAIKIVESSVGTDPLRQIVNQYFAGFLQEYGFSQAPQKRSGGKFEKVEFKGLDCRVLISHEFGDDYLLIVVQDPRCSGVADFDNSAKTLRLGDITRDVMPLVSPEAIEANNSYFSDLEKTATTSQRCMVLKRAKEIRLCLGAM